MIPLLFFLYAPLSQSPLQAKYGMLERPASEGHFGRNTNACCQKPLLRQCPASLSMGRKLELQEQKMESFASSMGMVRTNKHNCVPETAMERAASSKLTTKALNSASSQQVCPQGVRLSEILQTFQGIKPTASSAAEICRKVILVPQTSVAQHCRLVDVTDPKMLGIPYYYLIYNSQLSLQTTLTTVKKHFEHLRQHPDDVFLWFDLFCVNLHLQATSNIIKSLDKVIVVLGTTAGEILSRSWPLFELLQASKSERRDRLIVIPTGDDCWSPGLVPLIRVS
ncbi:hypothetical protein CEUSTIGMA_g11527.t1 [Chlamydomonas eustigma]|uniref:Heterokaryon incompatibility domain-containing protein n=1 Tax=Chlamydomonas eustigma TaxID=1157962 RepID=A0A250XM07_9CHLO|nr:hypothetical protein CEUSTIGMA_g11527.t1 [Chlamydomonas eustigma]|eukprot:GAX84104.1 hypothetical protein CEUSTIGMA_g11527.t1 [Chlamydomonas eustigma]